MTLQELRPERCPCGNTTFVLTTPYHTHQVLELPPIAMEVTHWVLHQGWCPDCGRWSKAQVPAEHATGYGPRLSALMGELAGAYGNGRRIVQTFCASVLQVPISLGAIQKVLDRVSQAIEPHSLAIATQTRHAPVIYIDDTPWILTHTLQWLWVMVSDTAALYMIYPIGPRKLLPPSSTTGPACWSVTAMVWTKTGARRGKHAWLTSSAVPEGWQPVRIPTWRPVGPGPLRSCSGCVILPRPHR